MKRRRYDNRIAFYDKGATMIVAIIIMAILIIFSFALILVSYTLYASQNKNNASMRCQEATNTLSQALDDELMDEDAAMKSHLYQYIRFNICQQDGYWPYYNESESGHSGEYAYRYFDFKYNNKKTQNTTSSIGETGDGEGGAGDTSSDESNLPKESDESAGMVGFPGNIKMCIYWKLPEGKTLADIQNDKNGILLFVEITSEAANQTYTVKNVYELSETTYEADDDNKQIIEDIASESTSLAGVVNPLGKSIDCNKNWEWKKSNAEY